MMHATLLVATAMVGIDTGWRPADDGGMEYIIQISPALFESLRDGDVLSSEIAPGLRDIRRFRIVVGDQRLPRVAMPELGLRSQHNGADAKSPPRIVETKPAAEPPLPKKSFADSFRESFPEATVAVPAEKPPLVNTKPATTQVEPAFPPPALPPEKAVAKSTQPPRRFNATEDSEQMASHVSTLKPAVEQDDPGSAVSPSDRLESGATTNASSSDPSPAKPWLPLTLAVAAFIASLSANGYLAWMWLETRGRYRSLASQQLSTS